MTAFEKVSEKNWAVKHKDSGYDKKLTVKQFKLPNGVTETFILDDDKDSVQIFPITEDRKVITVVQFRPGTEKEEIELPGGGLEPKEDHARAALRELLEETSFTGRLTFIGAQNYSPYSSGRRYMYMATGCHQAAKSLDLDPNEFLKVKLWTLEEFRDLMQKGHVRGHDLAYMALDKLGLL